MFPTQKRTFACFKISQKARKLWSLRHLEKEWRPAHALATGHSFALINVDANEPIFLSGVDIQVAFYAVDCPIFFFKICSLSTPSKRGKLTLLSSSTRVW